MSKYVAGLSGNPKGRRIGTRCAKTLLREAIAVVSVAMSDPALPISLRVQAAVAVIDSNNFKTRTHAPSDIDNG